MIESIIITTITNINIIAMVKQAPVLAPLICYLPVLQQHQSLILTQMMRFPRWMM
jgi:hypothetical protein